MPTSEPYFAKYLRLVPPDTDPVERLERQSSVWIPWLRSVSSDESLRLHPPYTWTFRQVVQHVNDCERVFAFRLLWIARGETAPLAPFDEMQFSQLANPNRLDWGFCIDEFDSIRRSTIRLLQGLEDDTWNRAGTAAGFPLTVRTLADMIYGHVEHHARILRDRAK